MLSMRIAKQNAAANEADLQADSGLRGFPSGFFALLRALSFVADAFFMVNVVMAVYGTVVSSI